MDTIDLANRIKKVVLHLNSTLEICGRFPPFLLVIKAIVVECLPWPERINQLLIIDPLMGSKDWANIGLVCLRKVVAVDEEVGCVLHGMSEGIRVIRVGSRELSISTSQL